MLGANGVIQIGAGIQIPPNSAFILKKYGLLEKIESVSVRPSDFIIRSYRDGTILNKLNMVPYAEKRYGVPYLHIHRADYHKILVAEAQRLGVKMHLGSVVRGIDFDRAIVHIRDKPDFQADLILGADGLKSICRESLLGHPDPPHLTGDLAYRIVIKADDMKKHPDLRDLAEKPAINYWMGPHGHVVCYLLKGGGLYNIVLICPDNLPEMLNTAKADLQEMRDFFDGWDPKLKTLLGMVQETTKWRLLNSEEMESWSHPTGKFALLGDACHATLPYLYVLLPYLIGHSRSDLKKNRAQGAAQAVEDGAVLGALFERIEHKAQIGDVLAIYERLRKDRTTRVVKGSTALRDIFHMVDGPRQQERDRQLSQHEPFDGYPNRWADPVFQPWLFGYNAFQEVDNAWKRYKQGTFPGTTGQFKSHL